MHHSFQFSHMLFTHTELPGSAPSPLSTPHGWLPALLLQHAPPGGTAGVPGLGTWWRGLRTAPPTPPAPHELPFAAPQLVAGPSWPQPPPSTAVGRHCPPPLRWLSCHVGWVRRSHGDTSVAVGTFTHRAADMHGVLGRM